MFITASLQNVTNMSIKCRNFVLYFKLTFWAFSRRLTGEWRPDYEAIH